MSSIDDGDKQSSKKARLYKKWETIFSSIDSTSSSIENSSDFHREQCMAVVNDSFQHKFKSDQKQLGKIYQCIDHVECPHLYRVSPHKNSMQWFVQECGEVHNLDSALCKPIRGIHWKLKQKIDPLLKSKVSANRILSQLQLDKDINQTLIPSVRQIINRGHKVCYCINFFLVIFLIYFLNKR
jgi:hypothetical protein